MSLVSRLNNFLSPPTPINFFKQIIPAAMIAGSQIDYDEENTMRNYRKYIPYSSLQVVNRSSSVNVEVWFDYDVRRKLLVLSGGTKAIKNQPFRSFIVKNTHATDTLAENELILELETIR